MKIDAVEIVEPRALALAEKHKQLYGKKHARNKDLHGIPLDKAVGTLALWYRDTPPSSAIKSDQKHYWGKTVKSIKIDPADSLAALTHNNELPRYLLEVIEFNPKEK